MAAVQTLPARFKDPDAPPVPTKILSRWDQFLGLVATGTKVEDAMLKCYIKRSEIQAVLSAGPTEKKRYQDAKLAGLRQAYSEFDLDEFFNRVAMGLTVKAAFTEVFGTDVSPVFYELLRADPDLEDRYQSAMKTKAVLEIEKVLDIVDDDTNDTLPGPKGGEIPNMAAVNRSKLKAETRTKLAGTWHRRLFGEKEPVTNINVQVNHSERLEEARARARDKRATPRSVTVVEGQFHSMPAPEPAAPEPMDTKWMED